MIVVISATMIVFSASCGTPGPLTARPDPNAASSGTLGSVKATDGSVLHQEEIDTSRVDTSKRGGKR